MRRSAAAIVLLFIPAFVTADEITKHTLKALEGHTYVMYVPPTPRPDERLPLIITLHGSGRNGRSLVERWRALAKQERIVLAGPDAVDPRGWQFPHDGPDALYFLVQEVAAQAPIDMRRIYLFGHSGGAIFALSNGLAQSEYFAAVSIHAGALNEQFCETLVKSAVRKIPFQIQIGTNDRFFPLERVRASRDRLQEAGFPVEYAELTAHTHNYYDKAAFINAAAWKFLSGRRLEGEPRYRPSAIR